jgi:hypothetical protein
MDPQRHPGEVALLNYSSGLPVEAELKEHIESCPACSEKVAALRREQLEFAPPKRAEEKLEEYLARLRRGRKIFYMRILGWASAAVFLLVAGVFTFMALRQPGTTRVKGSVSANVYVKRGEEVVRADEGFRYKKGDKIRLGILSPAPVLVTVLVEREGGWSPIPDLTDVAVPPGKEKILPGSMSISCSGEAETIRLRVSKAKRVEDRPGKEPDSRVIVFKCEQP